MPILPVQRRLRRAASALVLAVVVLATGCSGSRGDASGPRIEGATEGSTPPTLMPAVADGEIDSVAMVGDSITRGSEPALRAAFADLGVDVAAIDAADGRRMTVEGFAGSGLAAVDRVKDSADPDLWVVALGTNDVPHYASDDEAREAIDAVLDALPDDDGPLVWVDVFLAGSEDRCEAFNDTLRAALDERGNATIVEWSAVAGEDGMLTDGIHPGTVGVEVFADLVAGGVDRMQG